MPEEVQLRGILMYGLLLLKLHLFKKKKIHSWSYLESPLSFRISGACFY